MRTNKKAQSFNSLIALAVFISLLVLMVTINTQKNAVRDRPLGSAQMAILEVAHEADKALLYLDEAADLASIKAAKTFNEEGGLEADYEEGTYMCGQFIYSPYWYNLGQTCYPDFEENLKKHYESALFPLLQAHPAYSYPYAFDIALEPLADRTTKVTGVSPTKMNLRFRGGGELGVSVFTGEKFTPDYAEAQQPATLNHGGRGGREVEYVVVHYTASGTLEGAVRTLSERRYSYHYIIDHHPERDGQINQYVPEDMAAQHAGCTGSECLLQNMNRPSIGISFVNCGYLHNCGGKTDGEYKDANGKVWEDYTEAQIDSFTSLVADIANRYPNLRNQDGTFKREAMLMHSDIKKTKVDPGPAFEDKKDQVIDEINKKMREQPARSQPLAGEEQPTNKITGQAVKEREEGLIGPSGWCDGTESLPSGYYAKRIDEQAWNSQEQTYADIAINAGTAQGVDPALIVTHMIFETSMGNNDKCTLQGKSSLTGCTWYPKCSSGCGCTGEATVSDQAQLACTARTDKQAYLEATTGTSQGVGAYTKCHGQENEDKMWTCILCVYQGNYAEDLTNTGAPYFTKDGTCDYAEKFKQTYCSWRAYFEDRGYETKERPPGTYKANYEFDISFQSAIPVDLESKQKVVELTEHLAKSCQDDLEACIPRAYTWFLEKQRQASIDEAQAQVDAKCQNDQDKACIVKHYLLYLATLPAPQPRMDLGCTSVLNDPFIEEFITKIDGCTMMPEGIPCTFTMEEKPEHDITFTFSDDGVKVILTTDQKTAFQEQNPGLPTKLLEHPLTGGEYLIDTGQGPTKTPYKLRINNTLLNIGGPKVTLFIDNKEATKERLDKQAFTFTKDAQGSMTYHQEAIAEALEPYKASFTLCEADQGLRYAIKLQDRTPNEVRNIRTYYNLTMNRYDVSWQPVTAYEDGTAIKDIAAYELYCSQEAFTPGTLPPIEAFNQAITRKDGSYFPASDYAQQGIMTARIERCGAGRIIPGMTYHLVIIAKDGAGQLNIDYQDTPLTPAAALNAPIPLEQPLQQEETTSNDHEGFMEAILGN